MIKEKDFSAAIQLPSLVNFDNTKGVCMVQLIKLRCVKKVGWGHDMHLS